jgi:hypothetical protein
MQPPSQTLKGSVKGIKSSDIERTKVCWEGVTDGTHCLERQGEGDGPLGLLPQYVHKTKYIGTKLIYGQLYGVRVHIPQGI